MFTLFIPVVILGGLWVAWEPMKAVVSRGRAESNLQSEEVREEVLEIRAAINVKREDNNKEAKEIKI